MVLEQLRRVRWAVRATLLLGVAASVVANVLHALDNPISQAIAAWPPLALLLTVELISRVPVHRRYLAVLRLVATAIIAGIAAWVSYWHMVGVAARYGETGASPYLLPLSVDGLIVVASICLVELGGRISTLERAQSEPTAPPMTSSHPQPQPLSQPQPGTISAEFPGDPVPGLIPSPLAAAQARVNGPGRASGPLGPATAAALAEVAAALPQPAPRTLSRATAPARPSTPTRENRPSTPTRENRPSATARENRPSTSARENRPSTSAREAANGRVVPAQRSTPSGRAVTAPADRSGKSRRTPAETIALATQIKAARPGLNEAEIAAELGISESRWRTIRREAA
ncbi:hypothetical protein Aab01nite_16290 [Paractinoplanes abujensis]|uniref:DUF2637 domain-containing protein n=1 Tax=Paractinoplanes abujensis TaxID=882441 RepID=A0A7W7CZJ1_9ACTN|nr:DUF2637 domain-containing protein [Actinoplanes abujensis]MBB4697486.1 hypothetical protein [Actinoplanes abujensis]GID18039.1 hypothetical protein Aab01nite_16290 [Actinoplanes abujensis]